MRWAAIVLAGCQPGGAILYPHAAPATLATATDGPSPRVIVEGAAGSTATPSDVLFGDGIPGFAIDIDDAGMQSLRDDPTRFVPAGFTWDGVRYYPVGVRVKGQGSFQPIDDKPSLKIHFTEYADLHFLGLERLTLNNMTSDASMMHEEVAYWMYRSAGIPAVRANHAWLTLNGDQYGLYTLMDDVDATFAKGWYPEPLGTMWEMDDADFEDALVSTFQLEFGPEDRAPLQAVADGIALGGPAGWTAIQAAIDADEVLREFAVCSVIGQFDAYPYRYPGDDTHWYDDPSTGLLTALPHGVDETFNAAGDMAVPIGDFPEFCGERPQCWDLWTSQIWDVYDTSVAVDLAGEAAKVRDKIAPFVPLDENKGYSDDDVAAAQDDMDAFIADREAAIEAAIGPR